MNKKCGLSLDIYVNGDASIQSAGFSLYVSPSQSLPTDGKISEVSLPLSAGCVKSKIPSISITALTSEDILESESYKFNLGKLLVTAHSAAKCPPEEHPNKATLEESAL